MATNNSINSPLPTTVGKGGTANTTFTAYATICAGTTATGAFQNVSGLGTAGQALSSAGAGALPTWATVVTSVSGTSNRIAVAGTASVPVLNISINYVGQTTITTLGTIATGTWSATNIALNKGGTNAALTADNGGIFYSTASAGAILASTATANQVLLSGSSTTPAWSTATYPATTTVNQLLYSSATNVISGLATANNSVLITGAGGIPALSSTLPAGVLGNITSTGTITSGVWNGTAVDVAHGGTGNTTFTAYSVICAGTTATGVFQNVSGVGTSGQVLTSAGAGALPAWATPSAGGITTLAGDSGTATGSTVTISGGSNLTSTAASATVTVNLDNSPSVSGSLTAGTFITATAGDIKATSGNLVLSATSTSSVGNLVIGTDPFLHTGNAIGNLNIFLGRDSGNYTLSAGENIGIGSGCLNALTSGSNNIVIGDVALDDCTSGHDNVIVGYGGFTSMVNGGYNIGIGVLPGLNYTTNDSSNIVFHHPGIAGESNAFRVGNATGGSAGYINKVFIYGIDTIIVTGTAVLVSSSSQLGIAASSRRFKNTISDMLDDSSPIMKFRPVSFKFNDDVPGADGKKQFGLIAEEVAEIMPEIVVFEDNGTPVSIKYQDMPAILLNELQKLNKRVIALEKREAA